MTEEQQNEPNSDSPGAADTADAAADVQQQAERDAEAAAQAVAEDGTEGGADDAAFTGEVDATAPVVDAADEPAAETATPAPAAGVQYGIGPFSLREVILAGVWLVAFVVSFFSTSSFGFSSVWTSGIDWILTIGVPTIAVFLLVLRRLSPTGIRRVGSLGIDQFASVAFSVAAVLWLGYIWSQIGVTIAGGPWVTSWVIWVEFVLMLAGVVLTVLAPVIPGLAEDFRERPETVAHRSARGARPVTARPRPVAAAVPAAHDGAPAYEGHAGYDGYVAAEAVAPGSFAPTEHFATPQGGEQAPVESAPADHAPAEVAPQPAQQAFWALAPEERDVVDDYGTPLFRIGPTAWALVIEDRGSSFVIRHEDGRVGLLTDVSGVTRG